MTGGSAAILAIAAGWIVGFAALVWLVLTAPEGFEDEAGFHFGREPEE